MKASPSTTSAPCRPSSPEATASGKVDFGAATRPRRRSEA